VTPALFLVVAVLFVVALMTDPEECRNALYGLAIIAAGVPYYWWWTRRTAHAGS
jgi:hypothetical protein